MNKHKIIMGSFMSIAALAVAIDHTKHNLPAPQESQQSMIVIEGESDSGGGTPCGMGDNPCGMGDNPCGMGNNPCGMGDNPCSL
jgi:hypothetical protein